jgi:hypothetical protein
MECERFYTFSFNIKQSGTHNDQSDNTADKTTWKKESLQHCQLGPQKNTDEEHDGQEPEQKKRIELKWNLHVLPPIESL